MMHKIQNVPVRQVHNYTEGCEENASFIVVNIFNSISVLKKCPLLFNINELHN